MLRFAFFLCLFPSVAFGQTDQFASRIEVASGKLVVLSAAQAESVEWKLVNPPADDNHQVCDTRLMFSTGQPGEYWFVESGASIVDGKIKQKTLLHLVKVAGAAPAPTPPGPGPQPPSPAPQPKPLPEGRFGLAEFTRQAVLKTSGIDRNLAAQLGSNFGVIASQIAAGTLTSVADANAKLKTRNKDTYKDQEEAWKPVTNAIGARLTELATSKKLQMTVLNDIQAAYEEIRDGFLAASN